MTQPRSPEEIRRSIEGTREELRGTLNQLQGKIDHVTDWRTQLIENREKALGAAGAAGFIVGGGIAGLLGIFRRG
jgi:Protein of unknown function (DUF3618)